MTELQRKMINSVGSQVRIDLIGGYKSCEGKCVSFTAPQDNEPEIAAIDIKVEGMPSLYEITEDEIESIVVL